MITSNRRTSEGYKASTLRGLRLYGVPSLLINHLRIADDAGLRSDADWHTLGTTPGKDAAYKMGLRSDLVAHRRAISEQEGN